MKLARVKYSSFIALAVLVLGLPMLLMCGGCSAPEPDPEPESRAAIIDQLCVLLPNQAFIEETTKELTDYGLQVDVYSGDDVTVDLYRRLPSYGYRVIIFRAHSGLLGVDPRVVNRTWLYTNEPYSKTRHIAEQLDDRVTYAKTTDDAPWCFAVSGEFILESTDGEFDDTAIIMMGCDALHFDDMAQAFSDKGVSTYIAWDASVILNYVDSATLVLLEKLCPEGLTVEEAVYQTMVQEGRDPKYNSILGYYPEESGTKTLKQLLR